MIPVLQALSKDPVANVRLNVCKAIKVSAASWKEKVKTSSPSKDVVKKIAASMGEDPDQDVKYQAKLAFDAL
jgi:hypothetical protein